MKGNKKYESSKSEVCQLIIVGLMMSGINLLSIFFDLWLKPFILLSVALSFCHWSVSRSPETCHWLMISLLSVCLTCLPLSIFLPEVFLDVFLSTELKTFLEKLVFIELSQLGFKVYALFGIYSFVAVLLIDAHLFKFNRARSVVKDAKPISPQLRTLPQLTLVPKRVALRSSNQMRAPVVWGWLRPVILLPPNWQQWDEKRLNRVLKHEMAHILRRDWIYKNALYLIRALFWFLPPIWLLVKRAELYAEYACDDKVISSGVSRSDYARDLFDLSSNSKLEPCFVAIVGSEFATRLNLILDGNRDRTCVSKYHKVITLVLGCLITIPFYCFNLRLNEIAKNDEVFLDIELQSRRVTENIDGSDVPLDILPLEEQTRPRQSGGRLNPVGFDLSYSIEPVDFNVEVVKTTFDVASLNLPLSTISMSGLVPKRLVSPQYPKRALSRGWEASIKVKFDVSQTGQVSNIRFIESSEKGRFFEKSIVESLNRSEFEVPKMNGQAVSYFDAEETFVFTIND